MKRHYYISSDLDDLEVLETQLEESGIDTEQIHVLSEDPAELKSHHLHSVDSLSKLDVFHSGMVGVLTGLASAAVIFTACYSLNLYMLVGWAPLVFLALVAFGFCAWEGGLWGIQKTNRLFERFQQELKNGMHVFFIDTRESEEARVERIAGLHQGLRLAGFGVAPPYWVVGAHRSWHKFTKWAP